MTEKGQQQTFPPAQVSEPGLALGLPLKAGCAGAAIPPYDLMELRNNLGVSRSNLLDLDQTIMCDYGFAHLACHPADRRSLNDSLTECPQNGFFYHRFGQAGQADR